MTSTQADTLMDAVIHCRETSRALATAEGTHETRAAAAADDAAYETVIRLTMQATSHHAAPTIPGMCSGD